MSKQNILGPQWNLPREVTEVKGKDPGTYLQFNSHMVTFYQQTYGEHSRFFLALREGRLIGAQCTKCKQVMVPAASWHCPECNFADMVEIDLPHRGILAATAPITIFPSASFIGDAPFCRGYIDVATDAKVASFLPSRLRTTTGLPRPGIFVKGVELKLVFEVERIGSIRDIFWVPMSEVPAKLRDKKPLLASDLNFETPTMPEIKRDPKNDAAYKEAMNAMKTLSANVEKSPRAQKDLAGKTYTVGVKTGGGDFGMYVADNHFRVEDKLPAKPEYLMAANDPGVFTRWVADGSLTDSAVEGALWLPNKEAFGVLPILDRLPRSVRRDVR